MNRILIDPAELGEDGTVLLKDRRALHIRTVLKAAPGDALRAGLIEGPWGVGVVRSISDAGVELACVFEAALPPQPPPLDLLLALPRPKVMKRLWPALASFAVRRVGLVNAEKVERPYFDSHVLEPAFIRERLLEGCEQAGGTRLPHVTIHRRFRPFVEDELDDWSPGSLRLAAHPGTPARVRDVVGGRKGAVLIAVGPEGGWNEYERGWLAQKGFQEAGLVGGALRSDVACIALMALVRDEQGQEPRS
jgi:16S rRNA (uracil1498-N3)-methyltransferase